MMEEIIPAAYFLGILLILNIFSFLFHKYTDSVKPKYLYWYFFVVSMLIYQSLLVTGQLTT